MPSSAIPIGYIASDSVITKKWRQYFYQFCVWTIVSASPATVVVSSPVAESSLFPASFVHTAHLIQRFFCPISCPVSVPSLSPLSGTATTMGSQVPSGLRSYPTWQASNDCPSASFMLIGGVVVNTARQHCRCYFRSYCNTFLVHYFVSIVCYYFWIRKGLKLLF
jgi:hypothetical protein